jgi:hypothetical protein
MDLRPSLLLAIACMPILVPGSATARCLSSDHPRAIASAASPSAQRLVVGCPLASRPGRPRVTVHVVAWCNVPGPHKQVLFKIKVSIHNAGPETINIGLSHWRLLVSQFVQRRWTPPPSSSPTGRPVVVRWAGRSWWAIPANPDRAAEPDPYQPPGTPTFATHWDGIYLGPGATYIRAAAFAGDVVFYVPENDRSHPLTNLKGDVAIAYFSNRTPTVVVPSDEWGPKRPGAAF